MSPFLRFLCIILIGSSLLNCSSPRSMILFQNSTPTGDTLTLPTPYQQVIDVGDVLSIQISSLSVQANAIFNAYTPNTTNDQTIPVSSVPSGKGYRVNQNGYITMAVIGRLQLKGLTSFQAESLIEEQLKTQFKELTVTVRNLNFRISVLGEVTHPGLFTINSDKVSLLEAIGLAGDITIYGRRTNVLLIRKVNTREQFVRIDLTQRDLFRSPYFYLHPDDVIYIEPSKVRLASVDRLYLISPLIVGILTSVAIVFTRL